VSRLASKAPRDAALAELGAELGRALMARGARLAVAESCTGGWVAKVLTDTPGSSNWFEAGFVTYSNDAKERTLGVARATLDEHGAVSEPVVRAMAAGARHAAAAAAAIAVSGVAGPGGGTPDKPVGLVHFAWSLDDRDRADRALFSGDREAVRRQAVAHAIEGLLALIQGPEP
jgi:nicotinamide-nucleotide amidase